MASKQQRSHTADNSSVESEASAKEAAQEAARSCGLVMPISAIDGLPAEHWLEVRTILSDAIRSIKEPTLSVSLVSDADDVGLIHRRIVQNIYTSDIVVADLSGKNPNVMLEVGMRLAFDKPIVLVLDSETAFTFDAGPIEHLRYPRDLRFSKIVDFKESLAAKVKATLVAADNGSGSTFLQSFGSFRVAHIPEQEVSATQAMMETLEELRRDVQAIRRSPPVRGATNPSSQIIPTEVIKKAVDTYITHSPWLEVEKMIGDEQVYREIGSSLGLAAHHVTDPYFRVIVDNQLKTHFLPF